MRERKPSPENTTDGTPRHNARKPKTMPLAPAARELGTDAGHALPGQFAPDEFAAALSSAVAEYTSAVDREATEENHKKAEAFARYVSLLHEQNPGRTDEILNEAHTLGIDAAKVKADYETIAEANRLQSIAATKDEATAAWQAAANELIEWRASFNAEVLKRTQAVNAADMRMNDALDSGRRRTALLNAHRELFPDCTPPAPKPNAANPDDVPEGYKREWRGPAGGETACLVKVACDH